METIGQKIGSARKKLRWRLADLGEAVGLSISQLSDIENDQVKRTVDPQHLIRIADALQAPEILLHHCESCPVRRHVFLRYFPELNNINADPAVIAARLRKEMVEAADALDRLEDKIGKHRSEESDVCA